MKYILGILLAFFTFSCVGQSYKVNYESDGFKGYITFEIEKGNYIFEDGFSYKIRDNVKNVIESYKNGQYDDVLKKSGLTFPVTLDVSVANNTVVITGNAFFYRSPQKSSQHSSQPSVRLSLYDYFPGIPDFSEDAKEYAKKYAKEQNVNLWKTTGGLKNLEVTFVMLSDIKNQVNEAIRKEDAAKAEEKRAASHSSNRDSVTTSGSSWQSLNQEAEDESSTTQSAQRPSGATGAASSGNRPGRQPADTRSQGNNTRDDNTMSWGEQQALARRQDLRFAGDKYSDPYRNCDR